MKKDKAFALYNRQYLRLYYGDLTISGENRKAALIPGNDVRQKGFDFHNTFNLLSEKLRNIDKYPYALMAFDLYSLCDLIDDRLTAAKTDPSQQNTGTFFSGKKNIDTQVGVLHAAVEFIDMYLSVWGCEQLEYGEILKEFKNNFEDAINEREWLGEEREQLESRRRQIE